MANSGCWQWRYRLVVAYALDRVLRPDEHVDHINGIVDDDRPENLRLMAADYHGRYHAFLTEIAGYRGDDGKFSEHTNNWRTRPAARLGAIISTGRIHG